MKKSQAPAKTPVRKQSFKEVFPRKPVAPKTPGKSK